MRSRNVREEQAEFHHESKQTCGKSGVLCVDYLKASSWGSSVKQKKVGKDGLRLYGKNEDNFLFGIYIFSLYQDNNFE